MSRESRIVAGLVLITIPTVMFGGAALLAHLVGRAPGYVDNPLRQDLWRAGHAHAGVYLILAMVMLRYVGTRRFRQCGRGWRDWESRWPPS